MTSITAILFVLLPIHLRKFDGMRLCGQNTLMTRNGDDNRKGNSIDSLSLTSFQALRRKKVSSPTLYHRTDSVLLQVHFMPLFLTPGGDSAAKFSILHLLWPLHI